MQQKLLIVLELKKKKKENALTSFFFFFFKCYVLISLWMDAMSIWSNADGGTSLQSWTYSYIYAYSMWNNFLDRRDAFCCCRDLYVHIGASDHFVQPLCCFHSFFCLVCKPRRDFNRNIAICPISLIIYWFKKFARILDIFDHKFPVCTFCVFSRLNELPV